MLGRRETRREATRGRLMYKYIMYTVVHVSDRARMTTSGFSAVGTYRRDPHNRDSWMRRS